jgi:SAM-dependent methyltransferase
MADESTTQGVPLRLGATEDFVRVAASLREAGFDEETLCRVLGIEDMAGLGAAKVEEVDFAALPERLAFFVRAFVTSAHVPVEEAERALGRDVLDSFLALDLLRVVESGGGARCHTPVFFYAVAGFLIASDRRDGRGELSPAALSDLVFPAIFAGTLRFLRLIPKGPADAALDIGAGTGIGALVLSRRARHVLASDINGRATHFARFNALLNGCDNVEAVTGDLYEPVAGRTFDRIITHPPYMPTARATAVWRDGGATGEDLLRRIVEGLPRALRPGGTFFTVALGLDTKEGPFEERVRGWLGEARDEFDVIVAAGQEESPQNAVREIASLDRSVRAGDIEYLERAFDEAGTLSLVYCALAVRRRVGGGKGLAVRRRLGHATADTDFGWAFEWYERRERADFLRELSRERLQPSPRLRVNVTHVMRGAELEPADFILESDKPFYSKTRVNPDIVRLITEFGAGRAAAEIYDAAAAAARPGLSPFEDFMSFVATLVEHGYLSPAE